MGTCAHERWSPPDTRRVNGREILIQTCRDCGYARRVDTEPPEPKDEPPASYYMRIGPSRLNRE